MYSELNPTPLAKLTLRIGGDTTGLISDAEQAIHDLNASAHPALAPLARLLLRTESIASSKVESLHIGAGELARAEVRAGVGQKIGATALDLIANIDAMPLAVDHATSADAFTVAQIIAIHEKLMGANVAAHPGRAGTRTVRDHSPIRRRQRAHGSGTHPRSAQPTRYCT